MSSDFLGTPKGDDFRTVDAVAAVPDAGRMAVGALEVTSTGEYRDERLYILETVKRQEKKLDATLTDFAILKSENVKFRADLNEAHGRVRGLMKSNESLNTRLLRMEIKAGTIATLAGVLTAGAIEALKYFLRT